MTKPLILIIDEKAQFTPAAYELIRDALDAYYGDDIDQPTIAHVRSTGALAQHQLPTQHLDEIDPQPIDDEELLQFDNRMQLLRGYQRSGLDQVTATSRRARQFGASYTPLANTALLRELIDGDDLAP